MINTKSKKRSNTLAVAARTNSNRIHIIFRQDGWVAKKEGTKKAFRKFSTQKEAIDLAKQFVSNGKASSVIVHRRNGLISS